MKYALKQVDRVLVNKAGKLESIIRERDILEDLTECPQVMNLEATFLDSDYFYFVCEYLENGTLDSVIKKLGKLDLKSTVTIIAQVVAALEAIHS